MTRFARRVRIELAYDGTDFDGWQVQPGRRTVQGVVQSVLSRLHGGRSVPLRGAGRTDAGVHARGQVADAEVDVSLDDAELAYAMRRMLPADVRPRRVRTQAPTFHARKSALSKTYVYRLDLSEHGDPFARRWALHVPYDLDAELLEKALAKLPGRRDWTGFAGAACSVQNRVRNLTDARFERARDGAQLVFSADGFLNHMVRNLAGTLIEIARRRLPPDRIEEILGSGDRRRAGPTAPARGLCLERVDYPGPSAPPA